ncbi:MAG: RyR domain-containing protein [Clostridia bacterium]
MNNLKDYVEKFFSRLAIDSDSQGTHFYRQYISSSISEFLDNETKENAYDVYRLFLDIYRVNLSGNRSFIDLLDIMRNYEEKASTLIDRQRDHYIHSVNVFLLGLAIYSQNSAFRTVFDNNIEKADGQVKFYGTMAEEFFFRWGFAALFHDIGYPVEIISNQIKKFIAFVEGAGFKSRPSARPYISYFDFSRINSIENFNESGFACPRYIKEAGKNQSVQLSKPTDLLAANLSAAFGIDYARIKNSLDDFLLTMQRNDFVDHGFYSALIVLKWYGEMFQKTGEASCLFLNHILDSAAAIFIHNAYANMLMKEPYNLPPMEPDMHPLGFLLVLCDEAQEWNREAYGEETKKATQVDGSSIIVNETDFMLHYVTRSGLVHEGFIRRKADFMNSLLNIGSIFKNGIRISATTLTEQVFGSMIDGDEEVKPRMLIEFIESLAREIHSRYNEKQKERHPGKTPEFPSWDSLPETLKYSNIRQARAMVDKLRKINCHVGGDLEAEPVVEFTADEIEYLARLEHDSWVEERVAGGWKHSETKDIGKKLSPFIKPYDELEEIEKDLDRDSIRNIIPLLKEVGLDVYRDK